MGYSSTSIFHNKKFGGSCEAEQKDLGELGVPPRILEAPHSFSTAHTLAASSSSKAKPAGPRVYFTLQSGTFLPLALSLPWPRVWVSGMMPLERLHRQISS